MRPSREAIRDLLEFRRRFKQEKDVAKQKEFRKKLRESFITEAGARTLAQIDSRTPVIERLVAFWSNHFTVSARKPLLVGVVGAYEREAIRPHVTGRFLDMLMAVMRHPAMLVYLDNAQSIGPNSRAGRRRDKGLNENLGREALELHTLGVDGGYTQADVREFARMLTGWSVGRLKGGDVGEFAFYPAMHDPGPEDAAWPALRGGRDQGGGNGARPYWPGIRRRRIIFRSSSRAISWRTSRRRRW